MKEKAERFSETLHNHFERQRAENQEKRNRRGDIINSHYDKVKEIEFKEIEPTDMTKHFRFPILKGGFNLPLPAKAIYPVLCSRSDFRDPEGWTQISRENIGKLAGLSPGAVDKGLEALKTYSINEVPWVTAEKVQKSKRRYYMYSVFLNRITDEDSEKRKYFVFYTAIIDSGIWAELSLRAKALYIALRESAYYDRDLYEKILGAEHEDQPPIQPNMIVCPHDLVFGIDTDEYEDCDRCKVWEECKTWKEEKGGTPFLKWLVSHVPLAELCRQSGISSSHISDVVEELRHVGLTENYGEIRIVHLHSSVYIKKNEVH